MVPLIPLWILFAILVGLCVLCARALLVEREEGLASSSRRLAAALASTLAVGGIAAYASTIRVEPPALAKLADDPKLGAAKAKLEAKEARLAELRKEEEATQREADLLSLELGARPLGPTRAELEKRRAELQLFALELSFLVMLVGLGAMALLADPSTLFLKRKKTIDKDLVAPLDAMARAAHGGRFEEALRAAATVDEAKLEGIELIDFLYVRGVAQIQHGHQGGALLKPKPVLFEAAVQDLARVVLLAPNMTEAYYALGTAHFARLAYAEGAAAFARASELTGGKIDDLPIAKARSACLVRDGERRLAVADADGAKRCFDEVVTLGVFTKEVPVALMSHRLASVLGDLRAGKLAEASAGISLVRRARTEQGLDAERQRSADLTCSVYEMLLWHKQDEHALISAKLPALLESWQPKDLPEPDEQAADEYLFAAVDTTTLEPPAGLFRALYFLLAVAETRVIAGSRRGARPGPLSEEERLRIARPLFRALQFEPRQREALAALGVLFYLCQPGSREKALEWLDAAVAMGTSSKSARRLLDLDRQRSSARKSLLDSFRGSAARFLGDAMVDPKVRAALLEELGRFQEFRPVLVELESQIEIGQESPTLAALNERLSYVREVAANAERCMPGAAARSLLAIRDEFDVLVRSLENGTSRISALEHRVLEEVGKMVLS